MNSKILISLLCLSFFLSGCKENHVTPTVTGLEEIEDGYKVIQQMLLDAQPGEIVTIPEGKYIINRSISLEDIDSVTIRGAGIDKTVLSFLTQSSGAEGLRITADQITIEDLTIEDAKGDCLKLQDCNGVRIQRVKTLWTQGALETNGGYGIYPVQCTDVIIDDCEAAYASDAGIYVGQSKNVVVKNSYAHHNVAGIEIENCINAAVFNCKAEENTGGILVFDLPDLELVNGERCKVYDNIIINNNHKNFAPEGNIVGIVPPGTGIILLAAKDVEVYNNVIKGHKTIGVVVASYHITERPWEDKRYDAYTRNIVIRDNEIERKSAIPDMSKDFGKMINYYFKAKPQDIIYDGIVPEEAQSFNPLNICVSGNKPEDLRFANVDAANDFENIMTDIEKYACL